MADELAASEPVGERYPRLFAPQRWEWAGFDGGFTTTHPPDGLVTNVHVVGFAPGGIVICRDRRENGWFLPGGTREPGESIGGCAARELLEEAGARIVGPLRTIGAHVGASDRPEPYRPHQPHPVKAWLWCYADVVIDSHPSNPTDGEQVVEVREVHVDEARDRLRADADWLPDLVTLAAEYRATDLR